MKRTAPSAGCLAAISLFLLPISPRLQGLAPGRPAAAAGVALAAPLHPQAEELRDLHQRDPQAFYRRVYGGADVPKSVANGALSAGLGTQPRTYRLPPRPLDDGYWQRISRILAGAPVVARKPGGNQRTTPDGTGFVTDPAQYRGANFLPPYAGEFLQVYAPTATLAGKRAALEDLHVYCSTLAHSGANVARVFYGYQSWRHTVIAGNAAVSLDEILTVMGAHGIGAIVTLGNSFGRGSLARFTENDANRSYEQLGWLTASLRKMIVAESRPWKVDSGFYQQPGADFIASLGTGLAPTFDAFLDGDWTTYVSHIADLANLHPALVACEYWNEPEGASGLLIYDRIARLIHRASEIMSARSHVIPIMEASSPLALTTFAHDWLNPLIGGQDWLTQRVRGYGFHPTGVMNHRSLPYTNAGGVVDPGYPPLTQYATSGLRTAPGNIGAVEVVLAFLDTVGNNSGAFFNELCIRGFMPQYFNDADLASRDTSGNGPWPETLGRLYWLANTTPFGVFSMELADGTPWHPKELQSMRGRNTVKTLGHAEREVDAGLAGVGNPLVRLHTPPLALSAYAEPQVLEGGDTTLIAFADGFNDVATHNQFNSYTVSAHPGRHKIWIRAYKRSGQTVTDSGILDLSSVVGALGELSPDLMFRDIDDNVTALCGHGILPLRWSLFAAPATLGSWLNLPTLGDYPVGDVKIDATWGGLGGCVTPPSLRATLFNPCFGPPRNVVEYAGAPGAGPPVLPLMEREFMLREQLTGRMRQQYAGLSCEIAGAFRRAESGVDHFVLAFSRLVRKGLNSSEHYGPGDDAGTSWSANYGDWFRNDPVTGQPLKREVILVDLQVAANAVVTGGASILPSVGPDLTVAASPGAEAIDPVVACNADGDTVIVARFAQDPLFSFAAGVAGTSNWGGNDVKSFDGRTVSSGCGGYNYLSFPYTVWTGGPFLRQRWDLFHQSSHWRVYPWQPALWVRRAGSATFALDQMPIGEPRYAGGSFVDEDWIRLQDDLHSIQQRDPTVSLGARVNVDLKFNQGWDGNNNRNTPTMDIADPHTWHPGTQPQVSVSGRSGNRVEIVAAWNQFPNALRSNFVETDFRTTLPNPAYEVRSLRLSCDVTTGGTTLPSAYEDFGSRDIMVNAPLPSRIGLSVQGPVAAVLRPNGNAWTSRAFFQMGPVVFMCDEGGNAVPLDAFPGVVPRRRPPKAATHLTLVNLPSPHPASTLELAAWIRPSALAGSKRQSIVYAWSLPQASLQASVEVRDAQNTAWTTADPRLAIVGVVPFVGVNGAGWPRGRIVWKADDDVMWADVDYQASPTTTVRRVSSAGGTFPTHQTEVRISPNAIVWSHDGAVMAIRPN